VTVMSVMGGQQKFAASVLPEKIPVP